MKLMVEKVMTLFSEYLSLIRWFFEVVKAMTRSTLVDLMLLHKRVHIFQKLIMDLNQVIQMM